MSQSVGKSCDFLKKSFKIGGRWNFVTSVDLCDEPLDLEADWDFRPMVESGVVNRCLIFDR